MVGGVCGCMRVCVCVEHLFVMDTALDLNCTPQFNRLIIIMSLDWSINVSRCETIDQSLMDPLSDANFNTCCNIYNIKTNLIYQDSLSSFKKKYYNSFYAVHFLDPSGLVRLLFLLLKQIDTFFCKDALNWSKVSVKTFIMLQKLYI